LVEHSLGKGEVISSILIIGSMELRLRMESVWHAFSWWIGPAVLLVWLAVEGVAARRLDSSARKQATGFSLVLVGLMVAQSFARDVFENRLAHVLLGLFVLAYALVRSGVLIGLLRRQVRFGSVSSLKLN
jgi:uncharacterized membrane protein AbrB (regulator of aidB expression)